MSAEPFQIEIPEGDLDDLRRRLHATRWPSDVDNDDWFFGVQGSWMREMTRYWADEFDWRAQEAEMNRLPQFRVEIDGVPIHFVHAPSTAGTGVPLILTHGWPWTFWDWRDVIEPLTSAGFDVVVPSLPGFGFSTPLSTSGIDARRIAALWVSLMVDVLGYDRFGAAGGDWGGLVTAELGHGHASHVRAVYLMLPWLPGISLREIPDDAFAADEQWMVERRAESSHTIHSHRAVHTYEPQTISYALTDSPAGTAAWLWGRRRDWSDCDGDVLRAFDRDFLCATASIYWLTGTISTSLRLYREVFRHGRQPGPLHGRSRLLDVPTGIGVFPKDLLMMPRAMASRLTNLTRWSVLPRGGHFAPAEQPDVVANELREFFARSLV